MAVVSPMHTGALNQTLTKDYDKVFFDDYARQMAMYTSVLKGQSVDKNSWKEGELFGLGFLSDKDEGGEITHDAFEQGNEKEVTFTAYSLALSITQEESDDDLTGHMKKRFIYQKVHWLLVRKSLN